MPITKRVDLFVKVKEDANGVDIQLPINTPDGETEVDGQPAKSVLEYAKRKANTKTKASQPDPTLDYDPAVPASIPVYAYYYDVTDFSRNGQKYMVFGDIGAEQLFDVATANMQSVMNPNILATKTELTTAETTINTRIDGLNIGSSDEDDVVVL